MAKIKIRQEMAVIGGHIAVSLLFFNVLTKGLYNRLSQNKLAVMSLK